MADRKNFTTSDGAGLSYMEAGEGKPFVMIPGWSQTAAQWQAQIDHFAATHRVIALDMRGHGESEKVEHGYRIARLSKDLREVIEALDLDDAIVMGHSMGSSIIWGYYDLWGRDRLAAIVHCDQSPFLSDNPLLSDEERRDAGAMFTNDATFDTCAALAGPEGEATTRGFIGSMFTPAVDPDMLEEAIRLNLKFPRKQSADLIVSHVYNDWRDVIRRIEVPVLVIGGEASIVPLDGLRWAASAVPGGATLEVFGAEEGGSHMMFMENPTEFNARVERFLASL
jgi:pimeloyl-ACP methyl ester carboxylesterase